MTHVKPCNSPISELQDFMFFKETIDDALKHLSTSKEKPLRKEKPMFKEKPVPNEKSFRSLKKDPLFWCYYVFAHGLSAYETVGNKHFTVEKTEKFALVELVRSKKHVFDSMTNCAISWSSVEHDLTSNSCIDMSTFFAICIVKEIDVMYINFMNNAYYEVSFSNTLVTNLLYKSSESHRYECRTDATQDVVDEARTSFTRLCIVSKVINAPVAYTVKELLDMCAKMGIELHGKPTKLKMHNMLCDKVLMSHQDY